MLSADSLSNLSKPIGNRYILELLTKITVNTDLGLAYYDIREYKIWDLLTMITVNTDLGLAYYYDIREYKTWDLLTNTCGYKSWIYCELHVDTIFENIIEHLIC